MFSWKFRVKHEDSADPPRLQQTDRFGFSVGSKEGTPTLSTYQINVFPAVNGKIVELVYWVRTEEHVVRRVVTEDEDVLPAIAACIAQRKLG